MDAVEVKSVDGGWVWLIPAAMLAIYLYDNRDRFMEGFNEGINEPQ